MITMQTFRSLQAKVAASLGVVVVVTGVGWLLPLTPPPTFEAEARIWVQTRMPSESGGDRTASNGFFESFMSYFNSPILTACEVLKSSVVLEEAQQYMKGKMPDGRIPSVDEIKGSLAVEPVKDTDIVSVSYRNTNGHVATVVVQAILDAFAHLESQQASYSAVQSRAFLQKELADSRKELTDVEKRIRAFQMDTGLINVNGEVEAALKRKENLEDGVKSAQIQNSFDEAKGKFLAERLGIAPADADKLAAAASDPALIEAQKELSQLEFEYQSLGAELRPEHPRMRQLRHAIAELKLATRIRIGTIAEKLPVPQPTNGGASGAADGGNSAVSPTTPSIGEGMLKDLISARADQRAQVARENILRQNEEKLDGELKKFPDKQLEFADLQRAEKVIFDRISNLESSLSSAQLVEAVNTQSPNYQIIDKPEIVNVMISSNRPKILTAFLLGLVLGALTFLGLEWLDPRLRRISAVLETLPLPVTGWVPNLNFGQDLEPIHRLRLSLRAAMNGKCKQIVVTSSDQGDGKTALAAALAISFSQVGKRVLLIDANAEHPSLHERFRGVPPVPGLTDYLANPEPETWMKIAVGVSKNLRVIPAGRKSSSGGLLSSDALPLITRVAGSEADIVIYDTPCTTDSSAALGLLNEEVMALIVVRLDHTHMPTLRLLATQLKQHEYASAGIVLAQVNDYAVASVLAKAEQKEELEPA